MKKIILIILLSFIQRVIYSQSRIPIELPKKSDIIKIYTKQDKSKYLSYFLEKLQENGFEIEKKDDSFGSYSTGYKVIDNGPYFTGLVSYRIYGYIKQIDDTSLLVLQGQVKSSTLGLSGTFQSKLDGVRNHVGRYSFNEILKLLDVIKFDRVDVSVSNNLGNKKQIEKDYEDWE